MAATDRTRTGGRACALVLAGLFSGGSPAAQRSKPLEKPPEVDPYTQGEPARFERLGYRSFGPFLFGGTTTDTITSTLGDETFLWVETEHFLIGSSLRESTLERGPDRDELADELAVLHERLDQLPAKPPKKLDPWLRLHLVASRAESLHEAFRTRLGLRESTPAGGKPPSGPALGMHEKFGLFVTEKNSTLARYARDFGGNENKGYFFHNTADRICTGMSAEAVQGKESSLHYALTFQTSMMLLCGIDGYPHTLPGWWLYGAALWFARERVPRLMLNATRAGEMLPDPRLSDWRALMRGRVDAGAFPSWNELLQPGEWPKETLGENMALWAHVDHLMQEGFAAKLVPLLHSVAAAPEEEALTRATGRSIEELDADWRAWVLESYRGKKR